MKKSSPSGAPTLRRSATKAAWLTILAAFLLIVPTACEEERGVLFPDSWSGSISTSFYEGQQPKSVTASYYIKFDNITSGTMHRNVLVHYGGMANYEYTISGDADITYALIGDAGWIKAAFPNEYTGGHDTVYHTFTYDESEDAITLHFDSVTLKAWNFDELTLYRN